MDKIKLKITALSPLAIGRKKPGSVSEAGDYIPGSAIRGAIATKLREMSLVCKDFKALFLEDNAAIFTNAYSAIYKYKVGNSSEDIDSNLDVKVIPATAVSAKTKPGFKTNGGNGVFDTLIDNFCATERDLLYDPSCPASIGNNQDGRLEPFTGFYSKSKEDKYYSHTVSKRLLTRVGINRRRSTSEDEILYSLEVLSEKTSAKESIQHTKWENALYSSYILLDTAENLTKFINKNQENFGIGGSVSRGLGRVKIEAEIEELKPNIEGAIARFNQSLQKRWTEWDELRKAKQEWISDRTFFTINLESDAILSDNWRRTTVISPEMLCQFVKLKKEDSDLQLHAVYSSYDYLSGWNSAWGLMKDLELVTNKGSVYLYSISQGKYNIWLEALEKLQLRGVGERTSEGFGQIQICSEFHHILRDRVV